LDTALVAAPSTQVAAAPLGNGGGPRLAVNDNIPPAELGALVDGVVRTDMEDNHIAGATVSVGQDGAVAFEKGYGFASYESLRLLRRCKGDWAEAAGAKDKGGCTCC